MIICSECETVLQACCDAPAFDICTDCEIKAMLREDGLMYSMEAMASNLPLALLDSRICRECKEHFIGVVDEPWICDYCSMEEDFNVRGANTARFSSSERNQANINRGNVSENHFARDEYTRSVEQEYKLKPGDALRQDA